MLVNHTSIISEAIYCSRAMATNVAATPLRSGRRGCLHVEQAVPTAGINTPLQTAAHAVPCKIKAKIKSAINK